MGYSTCTKAIVLMQKKNYQWLDNLGVMKQTWEMGPEKIIYIIYKNKIYSF